MQSFVFLLKSNNEYQQITMNTVVCDIKCVNIRTTLLKKIRGIIFVRAKFVKNRST